MRRRGQVGVAHVLDEELEEIGRITLGRCSAGAAVVRIGLEGAAAASERGRYLSSMPQLDTPAIVLSTLRYSETSKIVRLATREHGVQSAIAKGALRPRSRFGAALQSLSEGQARLLVKEHRELHILASFDLLRLHVGLAADLERYATASALAEVMLRFAPADPHPESYDLPPRRAGPARGRVRRRSSRRSASGCSGSW